jgi:putative transposase
MGGLPSFSRPGNSYNNTQTKAGWRTLKTKLLLQREGFTSLEKGWQKWDYITSYT